MLRILFLEPYYTGSHQSFIEGWQRHSRHEWTVLSLPGVRWKWRMRHASVSLAQRAAELYAQGQRWDIVVCSDMLNLPEWRGMFSPAAELPAVSYFHENQFTYPEDSPARRDFHYAYTNVLSCLAATSVWFNSEFHRESFLTAAINWLRRMPDGRHLAAVEAIRESSHIRYPGIEPPEQLSRPADSKATRIGWVARWENDKRPDRFADALRKLKNLGVDFQLILLGEQFEKQHEARTRIIGEHNDRILHEGFAISKAEYWNWLGQMDVVVSTADHEFFGIAMMEAACAGAIPVVPNRLAYPELFKASEPRTSAIFYKDEDQLVKKLADVCRDKSQNLPKPEADHIKPFHWNEIAADNDALLDQITRQS